MLQIQQWMGRYFGKKGQGLTEYAIVLLLVVLIGVTIWSTTGIKASLSSMYTNINTGVSNINSAATSTGMTIE
jgi:Flp pilus assembly pilin Flp